MNRIAIVSGGGRGIGAAIARRLIAGGDAVAVIDRDGDAAESTARILRGEGAQAIGITADITDEAAVERAVEQAATTLGPPTVLVNNAGITRDDLFFRMSVDGWRAVLDVHLTGAFLLTRAVQRHMVGARSGRIVMLSSLSAIGNRGQANYAAAKAGLQGLTKTLAIELGPFGVTVNAVAPGIIESDMTHSSADRLGQSWDEYVAAATSGIPVGRIGQPEDVAHAVAFFTDEASGFVTGQVLYVAGRPTT
jgi:3-oxoacyl-[acyl-carrier protein] reductase